MSYSGKYICKNPQKYEGDHTKITWRSLWELGVMKWCDENPNVFKFSSEEVVIPYICATDNRPHRYFVDFKITFTSGKTILVEIKPAAQVRKPQIDGKKINRRLMESVATYAKNASKWKAAEKYCEQRGWSFQIWDENSLAAIGVKTAQQPKRSLR
jgi:hypothetical protein